MRGEKFCTILQKARKSKGLSLAALGSRVRASGPTLSRYERGDYLPPALETVELLDQELGLSGMLVRAWSREKTGWGLPLWAQDVQMLEEKSHRIDLITPEVIPGLLQCPRYFRMMGKRSLTPLERTESYFKVRDRRFELIIRNETELVRAVIPVTVLDAIPKSLREEQLVRILDMTTTGHLEVQVLPREELPMGLLGPLMLFHTREEGVIAVSEHNQGLIVHDTEESTERLLALGSLYMERSFPVGYSHLYLEKLLEEEKS